MPARRAHGGSGTYLADGLGRAVSEHAALRVQLHHGGTGAQSSHLEDGQAHHDRLGDINEQGFRSHRGVQIVSPAAGKGGSTGASAVDDSLHGRVRRWQHTGSIFSDRYAAADPVRANISRTDSIGYAVPGG